MSQDLVSANIFERLPWDSFFVDPGKDDPVLGGVYSVHFHFLKGIVNETPIKKTCLG